MAPSPTPVYTVGIERIGINHFIPLLIEIKSHNTCGMDEPMYAFGWVNNRMCQFGHRILAGSHDDSQYHSLYRNVPW